MISNPNKSNTFSKLLILSFLVISFSGSGQSDTELQIDSKILQESRSISVHLPASYSKSSKNYPVIYALDGDYTRYAIQGTVDYYSFWEKTPECIVVSIYQNYMDTATQTYKRWQDCSYSSKKGFPNAKGNKFKQFISDELLPFIDSSYRTSSFKTLVGHSFTANFIHYFLLDPKPLFQSYIAISPYYDAKSLDSLFAVVEKLDQNIFYYTACGGKDLSGHIQSVNEFDKRFSQVKNKQFIYKKFEQEKNQATHSTLVPLAFPDALEHTFSLYAPIKEEEMKAISKIHDKVKYLRDRYKQIELLYGEKMNIREDDINALSYLISKEKNWPSLKELGELTVSLYPESFTGYWILGEYEENMKHFDLALKHFETGFSKLGSDVLNKADFQVDIDRVKSKIEKK